MPTQTLFHLVFKGVQLPFRFGKAIFPPERKLPKPPIDNNSKLTS